MGKRTSDIMAFAAILGGAGLGLGLTSLYAENAGHRRSQADDASMRFEILRRNIVVERGRIAETLEDGQVVRHAIILGMKGRDVTREAPARRFRMRTRVGPNGERLERLRAQVEELELEAREMADFEALFEALEGVESLEDLDLDMTIDMRRDAEDQRRKRRRRRPPRRAADVPDSDGSGN
jgi:hypothetical protein